MEDPQVTLRLPGPLRHPVGAPLLLLGLLVALAALMDPGGTLGTDTGAKVITLEAMQRDSTPRPVVGYWAEEWDPAGVAHPLYQAGRNDDGEWVIVTTLPMLEAARPLYGVGGYRATLLLPMLGTVGGALVARRLARRLGDEDDAALAFWVVGAASPLLLYGLDLWEHSLGVAALSAAVLLLVEHAFDHRRWWSPLAAGALLGAAATLRTEALVYATVSVAGASLVLLHRREVVATLRLGALAAAGFAGPWLLNRQLEAWLGGQSRSARTGGAASAAGNRIGDRAHQALVTTFGAKGDSVGSIVIGLAIAALLLLAVRAERRGDRRLATTAVALAALPLLAGAVTGLSFVPGLVVACPLVLLAFTARPTGPAALVVGTALAALPLVWAASYVGGAGAQWGGRYTLTSMVLLAVVATVGLARRHPVVGPAVLALSLGVSLLAVVWLGVRSRSVDSLFEDLTELDADVLIARNGFLLREGGAATAGERWLSAADEPAFSLATQVAEEAGARRVAVVEYGAAAPPEEVVPEGWVEVDRSAADLVGTGIGIVVYEIVGAA